jgi:hypothetical protein
MKELINQYFGSFGKVFPKRLGNIITAIMQCGSANTYQIARQLSKENNKSFKANDMAVYRLLQSKNFQIDDSFWRKHMKLIFNLLEERSLISKDQKIQINVDFTSHEDNFLILSASVILNNKAITIYFSMRKYPRKKNQMSQIKMEKAFIKGLRHVLSKNYEYVIVADRGFGNNRFANLCKENNFDYVLRINPNLIIEHDKQRINLNTIKENKIFRAKVVSWKKDINLTICTKNKQIWYLMSSDDNLKQQQIYENRFKIEKNYQDCKSSGYDLEDNKIRKYDRFKRLLYCVLLSHALVCFIGYVIAKSKSNIKKNSIEKGDLVTCLISAFLRSDTMPFQCTLNNPLLFFIDQLRCSDYVGE